MIYSFGWLTLVIISLAVSLVAFIWGVVSGQFSDQTRARYLPLRDQHPAATMDGPAKPDRGIYMLLGIIVCGVIIMLLPILLTFWYS
jgi:cbb3-type cytochrome oxidase maturation protein